MRNLKSFQKELIFLYKKFLLFILLKLQIQFRIAGYLIIFPLEEYYYILNGTTKCYRCVNGINMRKFFVECMSLKMYNVLLLSYSCINEGSVI